MPQSKHPQTSRTSPTNWSLPFFAQLTAQSSVYNMAATDGDREDVLQETIQAILDECDRGEHLAPTDLYDVSVFLTASYVFHIIEIENY